MRDRFQINYFYYLIHFTHVVIKTSNILNWNANFSLLIITMIKTMPHLLNYYKKIKMALINGLTFILKINT